MESNRNIFSTKPNPVGGGGYCMEGVIIQIYKWMVPKGVLFHAHVDCTAGAVTAAPLYTGAFRCRIVSPSEEVIHCGTTQILTHFTV